MSEASVPEKWKRLQSRIQLRGETVYADFHENRHEVRRFLELTNVFRQFILHYAQLVAPISDLLKIKYRLLGDKNRRSHSLKLELLGAHRSMYYTLLYNTATTLTF